jgi:cobyrinic acid a,c-diamide synthase
MNRPAPRLVLAALRGGAGKTALSLAVATALQKRAIRVVPFKKGPDYIDAAWLALAAGGPCYNLDTFLMGKEQVIRSFSRRAPAEAIALIEGNRGLYDGMNPEGEHSTAELAKLLTAPVILVIDCDKVTRTAAAMVLGCRHLDPAVDIRGVILNRVGGARHAGVVRRAVERYAGVPVLGIVPRLEENDLPFPERHLGLVPPQEHEQTRTLLMRAQEIAAAYIDMEALIAIAGAAAPWPAETACSGQIPDGGDTAQTVTIGVIRDRAFQFYYHENIEALTDAGARIVEISAVDATGLPDLDALYIGGGFPETQARALSQNEAFRRSLQRAANDGLPIYAECGGFIYLGEALTVGNERYPMVGALPVSFAMERRPQGHGYTLLEVEEGNPFFPVGMHLRGHEFHYCRVLPCGAEACRTAFGVQRGTGIDGKRDGMTARNILAGFTHLHALGTPEWAPALVEKARRYHAGKDPRPSLSRG